MYLRETPWDQRAFGIPTYELVEISEEALCVAANTPGHFTVKVPPLMETSLLNSYGFYYCDTLLEPYCERKHFICHDHPEVAITRDVNLEEILDISHGAYVNGRFHRDFNVNRELADRRYDNWTRELLEQGNCLGLMFRGKLAGYFCHVGSRIVLHAVAREYRGKGIAKYLWSDACRELYDMNYPELLSSVSAANLPVVNLYISLGFRFRNPCDVYHLLNP